MTETNIFLFGSIIISIIGLIGILSSKNILKIILSAGILQTGVNLFLIAIGYFPNSVAPIIKGIFNLQKLNTVVDPLPQALVLTSIVIGFGTMALALVLGLKYYEKNKTLELKEIYEVGEVE